MEVALDNFPCFKKYACLCDGYLLISTGKHELRRGALAGRRLGGQNGKSQAEGKTILAYLAYLATISSQVS